MSMNERPPISQAKRNEVDEVKKFLNNILSNWQWPVLSLAIALTIAFFINRYSPPIYSVGTSILSKKYYKQRSTKAMDVIQGTEYFATEKDINWEVNVLKSYRVVSEAIRRLDWDVFYYKQGNVLTTELYPYSPIHVICADTCVNYPYDILIDCKAGPPNSFTLSTENEAWNSIFMNKTFQFGKKELVNGWNFQIEKKENLGENEIVKFRVNSPDGLIGQYRGKLMVGWLAKGSAVLKLTITGETPRREMDFLAVISKVIEEFSVDDKNVAAVKTISFIDEQLMRISDSLNTTSKLLQAFKLQNREFNMGSTRIFTKITEIEEEKYKLVLANQYLDYLEDYIKNKSEYDVIAPNTIGVEASLLNNLITEYVTLRMEERTRNTQFFKKSPIYANQNKEKVDMLSEYEKSILESVNTSRDRNNIQIQQISERVEGFFGEMRSLLDQEREYTDYEKIYKLNEQFYMMLLTEKVTASIARASQEPDYAVLDAPRVEGPPISPKKSKNYTYAFILGLAIPIGIFYLIGYLNPYIFSKDDLDRHSDMPFLGMVGHDLSKSVIVCQEKPKSSIAESFRNLRANLQYFLKNETDTKAILVTSSVSGEGKTFVSANLAYIYAISGKKTLVLGADLRKPALSKVIRQKNSRGLSSYLAGLCEYEELGEQVVTENLYVIHSGHVPPNPSELLIGPRMAVFMERIMKDYEVVIIDSPPIGIVSDSIELTKYAQINIIIVRQGTTKKGSLDVINNMHLEGKLQNPAVAFNDVDFSRTIYGHKYGYSGKYGYGYGQGQGYGYYDDEPKKKSRLLEKLTKPFKSRA